MATADAVSTVTQTAEQLAGKSDRYMFILTLLVLLGGLALLVRYFVRRSEAYEAKLEAIVAQQNTTMKDLVVVLSHATRALEWFQENFPRHGTLHPPGKDL